MQGTSKQIHYENTLSKFHQCVLVYISHNSYAGVYNIYVVLNFQISYRTKKTPGGFGCLTVLRNNTTYLNNM